MSSPIGATTAVTREPVRRHLSERQADTVARLTDAAVEEVRGTGYEGLTVRNVARRAGVAPATAYTYFASKDHLVAEVFWRRLQTQRPTAPAATASAAERVTTAIGDIAGLVGDEPELAAACTTGMLAGDPDVERVREQIGVEVSDRLRQAMGPDLDEGRLDALKLSLWGAMLSAGMGYFPHAELAQRMAGVTRIVLGD
ncbi:MAG TPA: helix-turn-helix domain-containing protein [Iamia sp.]|nr:helix-turn-helix domain-containing protein [Iamia sp.]